MAELDDFDEREQDPDLADRLYEEKRIHEDCDLVRENLIQEYIRDKKENEELIRNTIEWTITNHYKLTRRLY